MNSRTEMDRRGVVSALCLCAVLAVGSLAATGAVAQDSMVETDDQGKLMALDDGFPSKAITIWNAFGPEHPEAVRANILAEAASEFSPVPVVGRSMSAGPGAHYDAWRKVELEPDGTEGYNVFTISWSGLTSRIITRDSRGYEPEDLANSALIVDGEEAPLLVRRTDADTEWKTAEEMIAWAGENPQKLRVATSNVGSGYHLNFMMLAEEADFDFASLPTDGQGEALLLLLGGGADAAVSNLTIAQPHMDKGDLEVIMQWGTNRTEAVPDAPTSTELGYRGFPRTVGVSAHPETPDAHKKWLEELFAKAAESEAYRSFQAESGFAPIMMRGDEAVARVAEMHDSICPILKNLGLAKDAQ